MGMIQRIPHHSRPTRRAFLSSICASGAALAIPCVTQLGCSDNVTDPTESATIDLSSDAGVLNYFYAIAQLQSDFWTRVNANRFPGITTAESSAFVAMGNHATNHRNWLLSFHKSGRITDVLVFGFGDSVNLSSRSSTMAAALLIEDSAAQAFAGGIGFLTSDTNILLASKLASVAARHSATIRDFNDIAAGGTSRAAFAGDDVVTASGLEAAKSPAEVIAALSRFYKTTLSVRGA